MSEGALRSAALAVAFVLKRTVCRGEVEPLMMELPGYKMPDARNMAIGLSMRAGMFLRRAGTIILPLMVLVWFVSSYPTAPEGATEPAIAYSFAGMLGQAMAPLVQPLGFDWRIAMGLTVGMAAREVMVGVLGTVFAVGTEADADVALGGILASAYGLPTAAALLAWYVFSPQCVATLGVIRRETDSWTWPVFVFVGYFALAWLAAFAANHIAIALIGG